MKFGLIGHPVAHSQSPQLFAAAFGGRGTYDLLDETDFESAWRRFLCGHYDGINVTAPFKSEAAAAVASSGGVLEDEVKQTRATNFILWERHPDSPGGRRLHAFNTDALAVLDILGRMFRDDPDLTAIAVVGLGGAGRAALWAAGRIAAQYAGVRPVRITALHHDEIGAGIKADAVIYTLPCEVPGTRLIEAGHLIEANYLSPCCKGLKGVAEYTDGLEWLRIQAGLCWSLPGILSDI